MVKKLPQPLKVRFLKAWAPPSSWMIYGVGEVAVVPNKYWYDTLISTGVAEAA